MVEIKFAIHIVNTRILKNHDNRLEDRESRYNTACECLRKIVAGQAVVISEFSEL